MTIELTDQQAQELLQLADAAVRTHGLQAVRSAVMLMDKIDAAAAVPDTQEVDS